MSIRVITIDLAEPPADLLDCAAYAALLVLVRVKGRPIGWVKVDHARRARVSGAWLRSAVAAHVNWELLPHALLPGYSATPNATAPISVVVRSTGDPAELAACLRAVAACAYPTYELIVVAAPPAVSMPVPVPAAHWITAASAGAGAMWNQGAAAAQYELVAFLDAACRPDRRWLHAIADGFAGTRVATVSGPIAPQALDTPAQRVFEEVCGGLGRDTYSRTVDPATAHRDERIVAAGLGSGNNLALRRTALTALGGFNPALDAGADQELLVRLLAQGMRVRYSGDALVWHAHPADWRALGRTLFERAYGRGAALVTTVRAGIVDRRSALHYAVFVWLRPMVQRLGRPHGLPRRLALRELRGAARGLLQTRNHP